MSDGPSSMSIAGTLLAASLAALGVWLPWVRKRPVGYRNGEPIYTMEYVTGLERGLRGNDTLLIVFVSAVVLTVVLARYYQWRPDFVLLGAGGVLLVGYGGIYQRYWSIDRYAVEPGLYLLLVSGLLFVLLGVGGILDRLGSYPVGTDGVLGSE